MWNAKELLSTSTNMIMHLFPHSVYKLSILPISLLNQELEEKKRSI